MIRHWLCIHFGRLLIGIWTGFSTCSRTHYSTHVSVCKGITSGSTTAATTTPAGTTVALTTVAVESFFFGNQGQHDCPRGAFIRDQTICKKACTQLVLPLKEILGGFVCYKDYRGYCFQNGQNGGGASMVCKQTP